MKKLLWTTKNDLSAHLFEGWGVAFYENQEPMNPAELVYFRDPFNDGNFQPVPEKIDAIINFYRNSKSVDGKRCFNNMKNIEDKYCQYKIFGEDINHYVELIGDNTTKFVYIKSSIFQFHLFYLTDSPAFDCLEFSVPLRYFEICY